MADNAHSQSPAEVGGVLDPLLGIRWTWEGVQRVTALARWLSLGLGAIILLVYANEIGQFPEGMTLGEGLAFYMLIFAFGFCYLTYLVSLLALGGVLARLGLIVYGRVQQFLHRHDSEQYRPRLYKNDYKFLCPSWMWVLAPFGVWLAYIFAANEWFAWFLQLVVVAANMLFLWLYAVATRAASFHEAGLLVQTRQASFIKEAPVMRRVVVLVMIVLPLYTAFYLRLIDTAFQLAQFRKEHTAVNIKTPYDKLLSTQGAKVGPSDLGRDYVRFEQVDVLLKSLGDRITIRFCNKPKPARCVVSLPKDSVFVE